MPILNYINNFAIAIKKTHGANQDRIYMSERGTSLSQNQDEALAGKLKMDDKTGLMGNSNLHLDAGEMANATMTGDVDKDIKYLESVFRAIDQNQLVGDPKRANHPFPSGYFPWTEKKAGEAIVLGETAGHSAIDLTTFLAGFDWKDEKSKRTPKEQTKHDLSTELLSNRFGVVDNLPNDYLHELRAFPYPNTKAGEVITLTNVLLNVLTDGGKLFGGQTYQFPSTKKGLPPTKTG